MRIRANFEGILMHCRYFTSRLVISDSGIIGCSGGHMKQKLQFIIDHQRLPVSLLSVCSSVCVKASLVCLAVACGCGCCCC